MKTKLLREVSFNINNLLLFVGQVNYCMDKWAFAWMHMVHVCIHVC